MTGARPDTWMPLYIGDYLRDTMHLTAAQHGAYLLLIMAAWTRGGSLPDDNATLAATARMGSREWSRTRPRLEPFFVVENGEWRQKRVCQEVEKANHISSVRQEAGKRGGKAKAKHLANAKQKARPSQSPTQPPSVSESSLRSDSSTGAGAPPIPLALVRADDGDWKRPLFNNGLRYLSRALGGTPESYRSLVGKWLQSAGDDAKAVFDVMAEAEQADVADPKAWISAAVKEPKTPYDDPEYKAAKERLAARTDL